MRIQQFRQMAEADPTNELGHFSLGKALLEAGQAGEAAPSLLRAIELKSDMSKAYQLLGEAYHRSGEKDKAVDILTKGAIVADEMGDRMPRDAMVKLLEEIGAPVPELKSLASGSDASAAPGEAIEGFRCARCGRPDSKLNKPPFKGELGEKIAQNVCENCWREWIPMGTKVINELGLVLSTPEGSEAYDQYMVEFLQLDNR